MPTSRSAVLTAATLLLAVPAAVAAQRAASIPDAAALRAVAHAYYEWRDTSYPVGSSDQGRHTWDASLTDYSRAAVRERRRHVAALLARVRATPSAGWSRDDRIDWLLFRSQLEGVEFFDRVMSPEETNPQVYVGECSNAIFSLLKKDYAPHRTRALAATARLRKMPALLAQGDGNLVRPVRLNAELAIEAARSIDDLFALRVGGRSSLRYRLSAFGDKLSRQRIADNPPPKAPLVHYLARLIAHLAWADDRVLAALRSATNPDPSCRELFAHVLAAEHVWLARLKGETPTHPVWPNLSLEQCAALVQANQRALAGYVDALTPESLSRGVTYVNSAGRQFTSSIEDILLHVALHGSYHRGQIAWALRKGGGVPMATDYIAFVRGAPAATRQ